MLLGKLMVTTNFPVNHNCLSPWERWQCEALTERVRTLKIQNAERCTSQMAEYGALLLCMVQRSFWEYQIKEDFL